LRHHATGTAQTNTPSTVLRQQTAHAPAPEPGANPVDNGVLQIQRPHGRHVELGHGWTRLAVFARTVHHLSSVSPPVFAGLAIRMKRAYRSNKRQISNNLLRNI